MPYKFSFTGPGVEFRCNLRCGQCTEARADGQRCSLRVCIGLPYCWVHLLKNKKLRIRPSPIEGKGLFAWDKSLPADQPVFHRGDVVIEYAGQVVTDAALQDRYGDLTAPYGLKVQRRVEDAACERGPGALANHGGAQSNCKYGIDIARGVLVLRATKTIRNHREVLCDYGADYDFHEAGVSTGTRYGR